MLIKLNGLMDYRDNKDPMRLRARIFLWLKFDCYFNNHVIWSDDHVIIDFVSETDGFGFMVQFGDQDIELLS